MSDNKLYIKLEFYWWILTAIIVGGVLFPILHRISDYPFLFINVVFIIIFITFTRYIFLLKYTFLANRQYLKFVLIFSCVPIVFYLITQLNYFQTHLDEEGIVTMLSELNSEDQHSLGKYMRTEMLLFGVGSVIAAIVLPLRLLLSIWRQHNRGTV